MLRITTILAFFMFVIGADAVSQRTPTDTAVFAIESKLHYGFVLSHHKNMSHLTAGHFPAVEINIGKQTQGDKPWHALYKYPVAGISCWYADLANPSMLGSAIALYPYMNFHLIDKRKFVLNYRFGVGLGYLTKKFDRFENEKNIAIGSHVNVTINMFYEYSWKMTDHLHLSGSIGITHFSNGAFKTPNLGINIPTVGVGLAYLIYADKKGLPYGAKNQSTNLIASNNTGHELIVSAADSLEKKLKPFEIQSFLSGGVKELYPAYNDKFPAFSFSTSVLKPLSLKRKVGLGVDVFWESSDIRTLEREGIDIGHPYEVIRTGIHVGHQLEFSRLSFITQIGFYLIAKEKSEGYEYSRLALHYRVGKKMFLNLALKAHNIKADFIEWGVGYAFK